MSSPLPATIAVTRKVKPGHETAFEQWASDFIHASLNFEGHLGANVIRASRQKPAEYVLIFRFDTEAHMHAWEDSAVRREWLEKVQPLLAAEPQTHRVSGMEFWVELSETQWQTPPPRYKTALVTALALYPLNVIANTILLWLFPEWSLPLRALVVVIVLVLVMTYAVMPQMTRLFKPWLYPTTK